MKEIEVIINGDKLERVKRILSAFSKSGIFVTQGFGYGHQQGFHQVYTRDDNRGVNMLPKVSVRTVVPDELVDPIVDEMVADMGNATVGDGKIFVRRRRLSAVSYPLLAVSAVARLPPLPSRRIHLLLAVRTRSQP